MTRDRESAVRETEDQQAQRRDEALRRALAMPPKPHKDKGDSKPPKPKRDDVKASDRR